MNRVVLPGFNDLASQFPELVAEWHSVRNGDLRPDSVVSGSAKRVWWQCVNGHEWQALAYNRAFNRTGCPTCAGQRAEPGVNDFATTHPALAAQLHPDRNGDLDPTTFMAGSELKLWWRCAEGHEWRGTLPARVRYSVGCPKCSGKRPGFRPNEPGFLYFIHSPAFGARKIGIANVGTRRIEQFGSDWKLLHRIVRADGHVIAAAERIVLRWIRTEYRLPPYLGREEMGPVGGWTETFSEDGPSDIDVINRIVAAMDEAAQIVTTSRTRLWPH